MFLLAVCSPKNLADDFSTILFKLSDFNLLPLILPFSALAETNCSPLSQDDKVDKRQQTGLMDRVDLVSKWRIPGILMIIKNNFMFRILTILGSHLDSESLTGVNSLGSYF
jgi:hypothetical protein